MLSREASNTNFVVFGHSMTRPKQHGLAQGGIAINSSFQINIYHGTFLENFISEKNIKLVVL
jgi:hypothetical protein